MVTPAPAVLDSFRLCRAMNALHAMMREMLAGSGLEIRQLKNELVISNPDNPDKGRIYINYITGEVSWKRPVWGLPRVPQRIRAGARSRSGYRAGRRCAGHYPRVVRGRRSGRLMTPGPRRVMWSHPGAARAGLQGASGQRKEGRDGKIRQHDLGMNRVHSRAD
jgi:hypothetical protein